MKTFSQYIFERVSKSDLDQIEKYADKLFASLGIDVEFTRHFLDRVNLYLLSNLYLLLFFHKLILYEH